MANSSPLVPTRCCFTSICDPGSLLHILIKNRFSSRTARSRTPPFPLGDYRCVLVNCGFATVLATSKLAGLQHLGILWVKGNTTAHPKVSSLKQTIWQLCSVKVGGRCKETAAHAGHGWRRLAPLAAGIAFFSSYFS
jgi:hypothetical protein